ncbi:MAG: sigma-70 family RNA polymerase sigma factor [Gemmataceae bacterium]
MDYPRSFARVFRRWRAYFAPPSSPRPARFTSVALEGLEDRCVPAALSGMQPPVHPLVWGRSSDQPLIKQDGGASWEAPPVVQAPPGGKDGWWTSPDTFDDAPGPEPELLPGQESSLDWTGDFAAETRTDGAPVVGCPPGPFDATTSPPNDTGGDRPAEIESTSLPRSPAPAAGPIDSPTSLPANEPRAASHTTVPDPAAVAAAARPAVTVGLVPAVSQETPAAFRLTRTGSADGPLEVPYRLAAHDATGTVVRDGVATLPAGTEHVDVPATGTAEVVTLTLGGDGRGATATAFLAGDTSRCSEAALWEAYRAGGSTEAFAGLVEQHRPAVLRTCFQVLGSWHDAEDVSQLVFVALAQRHVRLMTTLAGWLGTVARNTALTFLRARNRRARHEQRAARSGEHKPDDAAELREELEAALAQLPAALAEAVRLRYLDGLSQQEAAAVAGCPRGTLSQRAAHGVRWLRTHLGLADSA